jgi:hypothetical protein
MPKLYGSGTLNISRIRHTVPVPVPVVLEWRTFIVSNNIEPCLEELSLFHEIVHFGWFQLPELIVLRIYGFV